MKIIQLSSSTRNQHNHSTGFIAMSFSEIYNSNGKSVSKSADETLVMGSTQKLLRLQEQHHVLKRKISSYKQNKSGEALGKLEQELATLSEFEYQIKAEVYCIIVYILEISTMSAIYCNYTVDR
jgi:hypothetical protein